MRLLARFREKELRMVWRIEKGGKISFLIGTAHFFPYSFRTSLTRLLTDARVVLFEGPLDKNSMQKVVDAGVRRDGNPESLIQELDEHTIPYIRDILAPTNASHRSSIGLELITSVSDRSFYSIVEGMKPWMAFFTIYSRFLKRNGWKYSVDMEAYDLARKMGKMVVFMESIEEQIEVLEKLSFQHIVDFLNRIEHWKTYTRDFVKWYLDGDMARIYANPVRFPSRNHWVIDHRDEVFRERMLPYLEQGGAAVFVGSPHVVGIIRMLSADGYEIRKAVGDSI